MKQDDSSIIQPLRVTLRDGRQKTVRLIEKSDLDQMRDFYRDVPVKDAVYYRASPEELVAGVEKWVEKAINRVLMVCLVLVDDAGAIHGEAWYSWDEAGSNKSLFGICMRPTVQGQGAGRLIMARLMEAGDIYGPPIMSLTVQIENMRAWRLYTSLGFRPLYEQIRDARSDAPEMPEFYMERVMGTASKKQKTELRIGWASTDITPLKPTFIQGQFYARIPEEPSEPLTATVLVLDNGEHLAVFVSCDLIGINEALEPVLRASIAKALPDLNYGVLIINATHTHTGPSIGKSREYLPADIREKYGMEIEDTDIYRDFAVKKITDAVTSAWQSRAPGKVAWGLDFAVVGRNRRWVDKEGKSMMYGNIAVPHFSHIEGYEDHSVNVLAAYDMAGALTGVILNVPCPSQVSEHEYRYSADYWHDTRLALRRELGENLYVMPQCSSAGDQAPRPFYDKAALQRMEQLRGQNERQAIAARISRAVIDVLDVIASEAVSDLPLNTAVQIVNLPMNRITEKDAQNALVEAESFEALRDAELKRFDKNPELLKEPRWYHELTRTWRRAGWYRGVIERYKQMQEKLDLSRAVTIYAVQLGDVAFVSNPFEYYLDFGIMIKARSPFLQTFVIQLAGGGTYVPSYRSVAGGGYGSVPASNPIGPEGGSLLADESIAMLGKLKLK